MGPVPSPPSEVTISEARELAGAWARDLDVIAREMFEYLTARIPEASADPEIAGLTLASCASNTEAVLSMIRHGIPASATEAPVAALEHARKMAGRSGGIDATLRFYRLGHAFFWERWSAALVDAVEDRDRLVTALRETAAFVFDYIDSISARVGAEHIAERERRQRRAAIVRADVVRAVLAGEDVDVAAAERALGRPLAGPQLAFLCWTTGDPAPLERAALAVAHAVGTARPLLLPDGPNALGGWVAPAAARAVPPPDLLLAAARDAAPEAHVALGEVAAGLAGFRSSRRQAERARRIAVLAERRAPSVTRYADVALADLLARDVEAARAFVAAELGGLAAGDPAAARARAALREVVAPQGGLAAAARALGLHRNTVLQRVRRAEELRGRPATERPAELHAALLLADVLGPAVLAD
ncbi:helix-turn-helix domain-containing protein [Paraconexibacter antarcticus]|uniref:Helix-turn-helix domain-containing protein n=1 Tax=Paraconexibacter antarcticus TaxID=2949664 RepID=A0ABY5E0C2_9ACTN|nr:helix-turn-helix domain-containing protein [Paraconexibacter antarcticus]UTI66312.1 helix-turn-helix domain-containing protein [Paraconexibacter antarcticus]